MSDEEKVLGILREYPQGIKLVNVGNQMGVNWRTLVGIIQTLLKKGEVYRINGVYLINEME
jgi:predicted transcriptional regulator of viral defense system